MKLTNSIKPLILLFLIWIGTLFPAQGLNLNLNLDLNLDLNAYTIQFSSKELSLKQALDELFLHKEFNIVYGGKEIDIDVPIVFTSRTLKLKEALSQIEKQAPVEFIIDNNHIIVKKRKLETSYVISGRVVDASTHEGLVAANVFIAGTATGAVTDAEGNFSMRLPPNNYQLIFRYVGYVEQSISVNLFQDVQLKTVMEVKENQLQSVDVTGSFSVIENIERGRTIETIYSKVIDRLNTNDVNDALHGRINGVWNTKVSGAPGDHHKIRIRGINSIFGNADPLYVVDGAIIPIVNFENLGISDLNSHDIESITVLKDASSTALYGNLGSNGVILIETKKGGGGHPTYNFQVKQGFQRFDKRYNLMSAEDFFNTLQLADDILGTMFYTIVPTAGMPKFEVYPRYLDSLGTPIAERSYQDEVFRLGQINEYQLSGSGNYKTIDYYLSGDFYNHNGVVVNTNYKKYSITANLSKVVKDKYSVRVLYKGSHQENKNTLDNYMGNNVILHGINYEPAYEATADSFRTKFHRLYNYDSSSPTIAMLDNSGLAPDSLFYCNDKIKNESANTLNLQVFYQLNNELSFRMVSSLSFRNMTFTSLNSHPYGTQQYLRSNEKYTYFNTQLDFNYVKQVGNNQISAMASFRGYKDKVHWEVDSIVGGSYGIRTTDEIYLRGSQAIYGERGAVIRSINSGIININYNYKKKYFISAITNYEKLKEGHFVHKGESYNSMAINYDLAREDVLNLPRWINSFNLYVNAGLSGNYPLNSLSDNLYSTSLTYSIRDSIVQAVYISNLANKFIQPEKVSEINYGVKSNFFKERLVVSVDHYRKLNKDLLIKRTIPLYYGGGFFFQNIGVMKNSGYEFSIEGIVFNNPNVYWSSKAGFSTNHQNITHLNDGVPITFNSTDIFIPDFIAEENKPLGAITAYKYVGKWKDYNDPKYRFLDPVYVENFGVAYLRNDTVITRDLKTTDKQIVGNSIPRFTFSWINNFDYKNFSFEMMWYGSIGFDKYNATRASTFVTGLNPDIRGFVEDDIRGILHDAFYESSYFVEDASFVRLKTLSFTYRQPMKNVSKLTLEYSLNFENLVTVTNYSGYDPEAAIYTDNNFTDNAIDRGSYPNPKGVYFSINMSF